MLARAILTPRPNSHPFQERAVTLEQPVKIGRSVARSRPAINNAVFDCKVLSRNHALLWYESGKFYLQDTKSSNGTFVNNVRLSKSSEESPKAQISSGDVLQFGVEVLEVNKKVTHGCIVASLQLFTPDGRPLSPNITRANKTSQPTLQDIYKLNNYLREAAEREEKLESKLNEMKRVVANTAEGVRTGFKILIEEDRLLTRIDILERQLLACHKIMSEDKLREEVIKLTEDKEKYQEAAKEALRKSLTDKLEVMKKCQDLERTLNAKEDHRFLTERSSQLSLELEALASLYEESEQKLDETQEAALKYKEEIDALNQALKDEQHLVLHKDDIIKCLRFKQENAPSSPNANKELNHNKGLFDVSSILDLKSSDHQENESNNHLQLSSNEFNEELDTLRNQIMSEDAMREKMIELFQEKEKYQQAAKETLRKSLTDKLEVIKKYQDLERTLNSREDDYRSSLERTNKLSKDLEALARKYEESESKFKETQQAALKYKKETEALNQVLKQNQHKNDLKDHFQSKQETAPLSPDINKEVSHNKDIFDFFSNPDQKSSENEANSEIFSSEHNEKLNDRVREIKNDEKSSNVKFSFASQNLSLRLLEVEEELATFKDRYASTATECSRLSRKLKEKEAQEGPFYMQRGFLILFFSSILLAVLIALSPRSF